MLKNPIILLAMPQGVKFCPEFSHISQDIVLSCPGVGFPCGSDGKESACNVGDLGSIPGLGRSLGGGHGNLLQYSCWENPMDRGTRQALVHSVAESDKTEATKHKHGCI